MRKINFPGIRLRILFLLIAVPFYLFLSGCRETGKGFQSKDQESVRVAIADYGRALFSLDPMDLKHGLDSLSGEYRIFTGPAPDTLHVIQIRDFIMDPFNRELADRYFLIYPDLDFLESELAGLFSQIQHEMPGFRPPAVYAYISGLLYEAPVTYLDSALLIGMDMFLGWNYDQYRAAGIPVYITRRMERQHILPACAAEIALGMLPAGREPKTLLDHMILHGKILYAADRFLPAVADSLKIGFTAQQVQWAGKNESEIWKLMIAQELLYQSDSFVINRFIQDGPFTSGFPDGAPAMLGRWIGWQIVKKYMDKHPEISLEMLFSLNDAQQILSQSGYKPKK